MGGTQFRNSGYFFVKLVLYRDPLYSFMLKYAYPR